MPIWGLKNMYQQSYSCICRRSYVVFSTKILSAGFFSIEAPVPELEPLRGFVTVY